MDKIAKTLQAVKTSVLATHPYATLILYGSYARNEQREDSDIDILILIDSEIVSPTDRQSITRPIYDIGLDSGFLISPMVRSKKTWGKGYMKYTPFFNNVQSEGREL